MVEKSVIEILAKVKAVVISYDLWMSRKTEEIFSLTEHYCIVPYDTEVGKYCCLDVTCVYDAVVGVPLFSLKSDTGS